MRGRVAFRAVDHLALAVADEDASRRFYERLGFDLRVERMDDGVLMLWDATGFQLALGPADPDARLPAFLHFGRRYPSADAVRAAVDALGAEVVEAWDEARYVSRKVRDPDGYVVELFWESEPPP
jgi:catechol 2,3-dioxygenase-like lactoylglutathione lyase family enzyme